MGLFNKKKSQPKSSPFDDKLDIETDYNSALEYLIGLSAKDFDKIMKVAGVFRKANAESAEILGIKDEPTTSIHAGKAKPKSSDPLDFLFDDEPKPQRKSIKVSSPKI